MQALSWRSSVWRSVLLALLVSLTMGPAVFAEASSAKAAHLSVELVPEAPAAADRSHQLRVWIDYTLEPGWHVYWKNAGDSGEPPTATWHLPAGFNAHPFDYPAPRRLPLSPLMDFGYESRVAFPVIIDTPQEAASYFEAGAKPLPLHADLSWLVCRQACIPGKASLAIELPGAAKSDSLPAKLQFAHSQVFPRPLPSGGAVFASSAQGLTLAVSGIPSEKQAAFFPSDSSVIANAAPQAVTERMDGVAIALKPDESQHVAPAVLNGVLVLGDGAAFEVAAHPGVIAAQTSSASSGGWLRFAGLAFVGGLILNLMPCVFPVLFIKALALVQSSAEERSTMRLHGLVYTLGILVSFWAVVAVLLVLRAGGQQLGWGFQFQSPIFVAMIALLLFFFALSLAGLFEVGLSVTSAGGSLANRRGLSGSFFTGVLAMIVATPCTAPFMGPAIGFALTQTAVVTFAVFTALALGLALPYLVLAFQPAWTRLLPRPGAWMEVLKQATAVPIFATVIWLVWLFAQSAGTNALLGLLGGFLLLAIAGWVLGRWPARGAATLAAVVIVVGAIAAPVYAVRTLPAPERASTARVDSTKRWQSFSPALVASYQAQGRPVFVDFTADWCLSCQVNERVVLERPEVLSKLQDGRIALLRADWTRHDESIAQALAGLGRSGVPTYALYPGSPGAAAKVLPEVLTPGIILDAVKDLPASGPATQSTTASAVLH